MTHKEARLCALAERTVAETLMGGIQQGHESDSFAAKHPDYHIDRAIRHICSARLMRDGHQVVDSEGVKGHLQRAITRLTMALYQTK